MTLKMALRWKNPDASTDINLRFKDVFQKGFTSGGDITPVPAVLQVDVSPFVLVNFDGAVVVSDATETVTVSDGQINYVVCRARYRLQESPILAMQVLTEAQYLADAEIDWLHVVGVVDLSVGGPYASVPTTRIFYENRDEIDQQGRSFWRDPVATFGALPIPPADRNRDGDVRLVLDSGSIYFWDEALSSWSVFDEVALNNHRDFEHSNGITGASAATTLEPDVAGLNMTVAAVPAGSAYTVNGAFLTSPLAPLSIDTAVEVGAVRGLVQVAMDDDGQSVQNYRVQKSADALDISFARIINISRGHALGTFNLIYDNPSTTLSWANGPEVVVVTGNTYRLFTPEGTDWVDVSLVGAAPGITVSDGYDVNASLRDDDHLLVGHWYWDGSAVLVLGSDERVFGTLGIAELGDDFKDLELHPRWEDLRGDMVYSGGAVSDLGGLLARVQGPIVAYLEGRRYDVAGAYNGLAMTPSSTNYIYVNDAGVLTVSTTNPSTLTTPNATVAEVVTGVGTISSITDTRDPQLIMGLATRNANLVMSGQATLRASHNATDVNYSFLRNGSISDANVFADNFEANNDIIAASGNVEAQAASVIADVDVTATNGNVTAGNNVNANTGDITALLGDLIASAGNLDVFGTSALQNLVTLGANLLSTNADAETARVSMGLVDTNVNPRTFTLLGEMTRALGGAVAIRAYATVDDIDSSRLGVALTFNAEWDNDAAEWNRDATTVHAFKIEWYQGSDSSLTIRVNSTDASATASWDESSWDVQRADYTTSPTVGTLTLGSNTNGQTIQYINELTAETTDGSGFGLNLSGTNWVGSGGQLMFRLEDSYLHRVSGDGAGRAVLLRAAQIEEQQGGFYNALFMETIHEDWLTSDGSTICQFDISRITDSDHWTATIIADIWAQCNRANTNPGARIHGYTQHRWHIGSNAANVSGDFYYGTGGSTGTSIIAPSIATSDGGGSASWAPSLDMSASSVSGGSISADRITDDLGNVNTEVYCRLRAFSTVIAF